MPRRVMIINDDPALATLLRYNFEAEGFQVLNVDCGAAATSLLEDDIPDLIVMDWSLPRISGVEICRNLRKCVGLERLPIIMLTSRSSASDRDFAFQIGVNEFVTKPFSLSDLLSRSRRLLGTARA